MQNEIEQLFTHLTGLLEISERTETKLSAFKINRELRKRHLITLFLAFNVPGE